MRQDIAIVGMACHYPEARSPRALWENVLARRRAFRRIPPERLRLVDYMSPDLEAPDLTYATEAAFLTDYEFDRVRFRVSGRAFRSADMTHWLALDVASQALADGGFDAGKGLPRHQTGVFVGNTLTGEFSRASLMRLRWPYVRRVMAAALAEEGWPAAKRQAFLASLEVRYKEPFPPVNEETLAGGLSNVIAGRICNQFDLKGGGYTVDGACASSLLAVATACSALTAGDVEVALAGGVDLSLDPFELVGFAKTGALAQQKMRVYDARSAGFWPGEGCGFVVLMRYEDAVAQGRRVYANICGWGISSDGSGGITRPEVEGQKLALDRAYDRAGFGIETVTYFEGHGTGTSVGDATELQVLVRARQEAGASQTAIIGSVKANIGHTKAAAGVAGLIKATMALSNQIIPPTTGCETPHPELTKHNPPPLQTAEKGRLWPADRPLRAGVNAMGFGGINTHLALEGVAAERRQALSPREQALLASAQDAELFLLSADNAAALGQQVAQLLARVPQLSLAEMSDLAVFLARRLVPSRMRAAMVAATPAALVLRLQRLQEWLEEGITTWVEPADGIFLGEATAVPRIGFLFPGQASPAYLQGGIWSRRFPFAEALYRQATLPAVADTTATGVAQPAIVTASLVGLQALRELGVTAVAAAGHSLGELTALHWGGAFDEEVLLRIATIRGQAMMNLGGATGGMVSLPAGRQAVARLLNDEPVRIACLNSPEQTVIAGEETAVAAVAARAQAQGFKASRLPVSHAFHSPLVAAAAPPLAQHLANETFYPLQHTVISTVTGTVLSSDEDLRALLFRQVTSPVLFTDALARLVAEVDLLIEVGPGSVLSQLVAGYSHTPVVALDAAGSSLAGLWRAAGAVFALGGEVNRQLLYANRFTRPFDLTHTPQFLANPCERVSSLDDLPGTVTLLKHDPISMAENGGPQTAKVHRIDAGSEPVGQAVNESPLALVRRLLAERTELPVSTIHDEDRLLSDLHLNSITVSQVVVEAARHLALSLPAAPTDYADVTVAALAQVLTERLDQGDTCDTDGERLPPGIDAWVRCFTIELVEKPPPRPYLGLGEGAWQVIAPPGHPLAAPLQQAVAGCTGTGVVICLPDQADEVHLTLLLDGARAVLAGKEATRFVLVQHATSAAAFARSLHLEQPGMTTAVVTVPPHHAPAAEWVVAEIRGAIGHTEAVYDRAGVRCEPVLRPLPWAATDAGSALSWLGAADVLVVTGGGKGITAECALSLAAKTGVRLALVGRSRPEEDDEVRQTLARAEAAGIGAFYLAADVTDPQAVQRLIHQIEAEYGAVTGIIHGAAHNVPQRLSALDEPAIRQALAPKVEGLRHLLAAVKPERLRLLVTFGSIIARTGLAGEAHYGLANEWQALLVEQFRAAHPACRCLNIDWSVWSALGMGVRLGRLDSLRQQGITPIPPETGCALFQELLAGCAHGNGPASVVVAGRFGEPPTLAVERPELPLWRFLEEPRVYYPGVELVTEASVSAGTDPYLKDHLVAGTLVFPAVLGLEAMAQASMAVTGSRTPPRFTQVLFSRPITVPAEGAVTLRMAALVEGAGRVTVALRSEETAFQVDHFRAVCRFGAGEGADEPETDEAMSFPPIALHPKRDLYGSVLFHNGRFRRLMNYRYLMATACLAEVAASAADDWFAPYLPSTLVLGDAGARDAFIHAIQACIPHMTLLPVAVASIIPGTFTAAETVRLHARERWQQGDIFTYDLVVTDEENRIREVWQGLRLRRMAGAGFRGTWAAPLIGPYLERQVKALIPGAVVTAVVEVGERAERRQRRERAVQRLLGQAAAVPRRADGKPVVAGARALSIAHTGSLTLAVAGPDPLGCDIERVVVRPAAAWEGLLGPERMALARLLAQETGEADTAVATRVWCAVECMKKAGLVAGAPLLLASLAPDGWVLLASGATLIATLVVEIQEFAEPVAVAILAAGTELDAPADERGKTYAGL